MPLKEHSSGTIILSLTVIMICCSLIFTSCFYVSIGSPTSELPSLEPVPKEESVLVIPGSVWFWGYSMYWDQSADLPKKYIGTPIRVTGIDKVKAISSSLDTSTSSYLLKDDGSVWRWKYTSIDYLKLEQIVGLSDIISISAGERHGLALKNDGTVWSWGINSEQQLGDRGPNRDYAAPVNGITDVIAISAGYYHSMALRKDGTVWTWGWKWTQYGLSAPKIEGVGGLKKTDPVPKPVEGLDDVIAISACSERSLALKRDGTVWVWGVNYDGSLGDGTKEDRLTPVPVKDLIDVKSIFRNRAVKSDGTVWGWGLIPKQIEGLRDIMTTTGGYDHSLALKNDGTVWAWGRNYRGQLGNGTITDYDFFSQPIQVKRLTGVQAIAAGAYYSLALQ